MGLAYEFFKKIKHKGLIRNIKIKKHKTLPLNVWGLKNIPEGEYRKILDMGCGGGKNISYLLHKFPYSRVTGADLSDFSLSMAKRISTGAFNRGTFKFKDINISKLPFDDESYDLVTAFETVYFWPGPLESFKEIYRILSRGGRFVIVNGITSKNSRQGQWDSIVDGMNIYEASDFKRYLDEAGFSDVEIVNNKIGCISVLATK